MVVNMDLNPTGTKKIFFASVISTSIQRYVNISHDIKVLMKVSKTKTFNIGFTSK